MKKKIKKLMVKLEKHKMKADKEWINCMNPTLLKLREYNEGKVDAFILCLEELQKIVSK